MTKQCNFCGNIYDSNETTCPFCMVECDDAGTYATNTTKAAGKSLRFQEAVFGKTSQIHSKYNNSSTNV